MRKLFTTLKFKGDSLANQKYTSEMLYRGGSYTDFAYMSKMRLHIAEVTWTQSVLLTILVTAHLPFSIRKDCKWLYVCEHMNRPMTNHVWATFKLLNRFKNSLETWSRLNIVPFKVVTPTMSTRWFSIWDGNGGNILWTGVWGSAWKEIFRNYVTL